MKEYDIIVIGAGVTGTAILYVLSKYTNVKRIALAEKYKKVAQVNSANWNNSQTLHFGDVETNYTLEKAKAVKEKAEMVKNYLKKYDKTKKFHSVTKKMCLAVGEEQAGELEKRHKEFKKLFPNFKKVYRKELEKIEPNVVKGRDEDEKVMALVSDDGYAVDYGKLSESFVREAEKHKKIDEYMGCELRGIKRVDGMYELNYCDGTKLRAKVVMVAAGSHSLTFAKWAGYGKNLILLPVAGNFYKSKRKMLNNKVYTVQLKKLPFAAIHGDPDVHTGETRFGPTAKVIPFLERRKLRSFSDFWKLFEFRIDAVTALIKIVADPVRFRYILKNFIFDIPIIGKWYFMKDLRKIVPRAKASEIEFAKGYGGIRPQIVNVKEARLDFGDAKLIRDNIIFNVTPSPGASTCLKNAEEDVGTLIKMLGKNYKFDKARLKKDLK